jgi:hypothetical protein
MPTIFNETTWRILIFKPDPNQASELNAYSEKSGNHRIGTGMAENPPYLILSSGG